MWWHFHVATQPCANHPKAWFGPNKPLDVKIVRIFFQVWPGLTAYPDFSNDATYEWWYDNLKSFHEKVPFDGLWIVSMEMGDGSEEMTLTIAFHIFFLTFVSIYF